MEKTLSLFILIVIQYSYSFAQCTADFSLSGGFGCAPINVSFSNASTGGATQWDWDFGDGETSSLENPSHVYNTPGTYNVTLTINGTGGCNSTKTKINTVQALGPNTKFSTTSATTGAKPLSVFFKDETTFSSPVTGWLWNFGDGTTSSAQNPIHSYTTDGNYTVSLKVNDLDGCSRTLTKTNFIQVSEPTLPVKLINFSASATTNHVLLQWKTSSEKNNKNFIIKKSMDGITFNTLSNMKSRSANGKIINYSYTDISPFNGSNYYQLLQEDFDGRQKTLSTAHAYFNLQSEDLLSVYPNPTSDLFKVDFKSAIFNEAKLLDVDGKVLKQKTIHKEDDSISFSLQKQKPGMYFIQLLGSQNKSLKIIKN